MFELVLVRTMILQAMMDQHQDLQAEHDSDKVTKFILKNLLLTLYLFTTWSYPASSQSAYLEHVKKI